MDCFMYAMFTMGIVYVNMVSMNAQCIHACVGIRMSVWMYACMYVFVATCARPYGWIHVCAC